MLDDLVYDDSEPPTIGLVPPGVSMDEVQDHIKIAHSPLLVGPGADGQFAGAYWAGTEMVVAGGLIPATLLTLFIMPTLYFALERRAARSLPTATQATGAA